MKNYLFVFFLLLQNIVCESQNTDIDILRKIHSNNALKSDKFFKFISNTVTPVSITVPVAYFSVGFYNNKPFSENYYLKSGINSSFALIGTGILSYSTKYLINRDRPYQKHPDIIPKSNPHSPSFPSGHTTFAFATATNMMLTHKKWYIAVPMYIWAAAVGYSRVHLGVHYPSDVIGGALIGTGASFLFYKLSEKLLNQ